MGVVLQVKLYLTHSPPPPPFFFFSERFGGNSDGGFALLRFNPLRACMVVLCKEKIFYIS